MHKLAMKTVSETIYAVECWGYRGRNKSGNFRGLRRTLKWRAHALNTVVTAGLNKLLDATFKTGLAAPSWFVGLKGVGAVDPADTMAGGHGGWAELTDYSETYRQAFTPGTISAGSVSNAAAKAIVTASGSMTVAGLFLVDEHTKGGATGTLYGAANFTEGNRAMVTGDALSITATLTAASA